MKNLKPITAAAIVVMLLAVAGAFIRLQVSRPSAPPPPLPEIDRAGLTNRDNRLYRIDTTNLFTGIMTESYPEGSVKSRSEVRGGQLNGRSEGFYPNGQRQVEEFFKTGVSDGVRTRWETNGIRESAGQIVEGQFHGEYRQWHTNGQIAKRIFFNEGKPHGVAKSWFPSGFLMSRVEMDHGETKTSESWKDGEEKDPAASRD
jgi:antitoxin component YwqK of YwqJK toxin-antitoxin module